MIKLSFLISIFVLIKPIFSLGSKSCSFYPNLIYKDQRSYDYPQWHKSCKVISQEPDSLLDWEELLTTSSVMPWSDEPEKFNYSVFSKYLKQLQSNKFGIKINEIPLSNSNYQFIVQDNLFSNLISTLVDDYLRIQIYLETKSSQFITGEENEEVLLILQNGMTDSDKLPLKIKSKLESYAQDLNKSISSLQKIDPEFFICELRKNNLPSSVIQLNEIDFTNSNMNDFLQTFEVNYNSESLKNPISDKVKNSVTFQILERNNFLKDLNSYSCNNQTEDLSLSEKDPVKTSININDFSECWSIGVDELLKLDKTPIQKGRHFIGSGNSNKCHFMGAKWRANGTSVFQFEGRLVKMDPLQKQKNFSIHCPNLNVILNETGEKTIELNKKTCIINSI